MIGIVIPAHNEQAYLPACLESILRAANHPALPGDEVRVMCVLDDCTDRSLDIVQSFAARADTGRCRIGYLETTCRNVGMARAAGASKLLEHPIDWLAFTDADSQVSAEWLVAQCRLQVDVVCGTIQVEDWSDHGDHAQMLAEHFSRTYFDVDGHRHIHGANLGMRAEVYVKAGGFSFLPYHEDVTLVSALEKIGARFAWSALPRVVTSARSVSRTARGFGNTLAAVVEDYKIRGTTEGFVPPV
jgi:glycosyltransferase involved in cell wall biosynthesis